MSVRAAPTPFTFAGFSFASWTFALRIWIAILVALYAGFWLQLDAASSAAVTVAILAVPTRGQAIEKAGFRLIGTIVGVAASIVIVGTFSQTRDLLLAAFAVWIGLCIYAAELWDGNRAYAAVLSGYTVGLVAMQQIDTPLQVFNAGVQRGAAIAVGIGAIVLVNDLLVAPDRHPGLAAQLADLHRRVRAYAKAVLRREIGDPMATAGLMREIALLRSDMSSVATESSSGTVRSVAARGALVTLLAELHAARVLHVLPASLDPAARDRLITGLDADHSEREPATPDAASAAPIDMMAASVAWASQELRRRDQEVCEDLAALRAGKPPRRVWRAPFHHCHRVAAQAGVRAACWLALSSVFFVLAGWPASELSLALVPVIIGLGATSPDPRAFTIMALIATPLAVVLAGVLEFLVLDGVDQFQLLALALAPVAIGATLLMTRPNPKLASLGRLSLVFTLAILAPSNPQSFDPQAFLFASLFVCLSVGLLFAAQLLVPPISDEHRRQMLVAGARRELAGLRRDVGRYAPEEAMFRDAVRVSQIAGAGSPDPQQRTDLEQALGLFDQAAQIRLGIASLARLADGPAAGVAEQARNALLARDIPAIQRAADALRVASIDDARAGEAAGALHVASLVLQEKAP
ncbi:MAG: FUSC family protein [Reyranella sp.]|uniref:FUSC family protein n=1 Tax=Reyranella sp. TaxID=1929291 RepID=UPI003D0BB115